MGASGFFQTVRGARDRRPVGFIGTISRGLHFESITGINTDPQAVNIWTFATSGAEDSTLYTVTVDGVDSTFTTDGSATSDELGEGLRDAINNNAGARAKVIATYLSDVLTLTGVYPGVDVAVSGAGSGLGAATETQSAATADVVEFGLVVSGTGMVTDEAVPTVVVPTTASFTAQVMTFTITGTTLDTWTAIIRIAGQVFQTESVTFDTNNDTTAVNIFTAINAVVPAETIIGSSSTNDVILTAEVEGAEFEVEIIAGGDTGSAVKVLTTGPDLTTSLVRAMEGVSVRRLDVENQTIDGDDPAYRGNEGVEIAVKATMWVQRDLAETWARGDQLYVSLAAATKGRFFNTAGTDRVWLPPTIVRVDRSEHTTTTDGLGAIRIDMGA